MSWSWEYLYENAQDAPEQSGEEAFTSQSDAETWLGEHWRSLAEDGVSSVRLVEDARVEYTMALSPGA
ncbi:MAG: hypothetical protein HOQ05_04255 [Corynebacteriales bacterium]|nr:hypothetical protein [Mycobacteriales bacterium]